MNKTFGILVDEAIEALAEYSVAVPASAMVAAAAIGMAQSQDDITIEQQVLLRDRVRAFRQALEDGIKAIDVAQELMT